MISPPLNAPVSDYRCTASEAMARCVKHAGHPLPHVWEDTVWVGDRIQRLEQVVGDVNAPGKTHRG